MTLPFISVFLPNVQFSFSACAWHFQFYLYPLSCVVLFCLLCNVALFLIVYVVCHVSVLVVCVVRFVIVFVMCLCVSDRVVCVVRVFWLCRC